MLKLNHKARQLVDAFCLNSASIAKCIKLWKHLLIHMLQEDQPVTWAVNRVWLDETLTETERCFMVFALGRFYEDSGSFIKDDEI